MNDHYINKPSHLGGGKKDIAEIIVRAAISGVFCTCCLKSKDPTVKAFGAIFAVCSAAETFSDLSEI